MSDNDNMISDEAVEAAARILLQTSVNRFVEPREKALNLCKAEVRPILEAAAPYMLRTVTTIAELDALPAGSVILDNEGIATQAVMHGRGKTHWRDNKFRALLTSDQIALPATVLHVGGAK